MKRKGFTLIELLAVIVILAIIALIAVPIIINIITGAKKSSNDRSQELYIKAVEQAIARKNLTEEFNPTSCVVQSDGNLTCGGVSLIVETTGERPCSGNITFKNGKVESKSIDFTCVVLYKDASGANAPDLLDGLIPVKYNGSNWVVANLEEEWYDYDKQEWANAVILNDKSKNKVGTKLNLNTDVKAMFVWIPRYEYKISEGTGAREIYINFISKETTTQTTDYIVHPAFTFGSDELSGIWVGKFETTGTATAPTILPNVQSLRSQTVGEQFTTSQLFNQYLNNLGDSHMMKNSEWGAVAYLSQSKYGKYGNVDYTGANKEVYKNDSSDYYTGRSSGQPGAGGYSASGACEYDNITNRGGGIGSCGGGASTTGNIYGIYDMSGGSWEYVMGNYNNTKGHGIDATWFNEHQKYYDLYVDTNPNNPLYIGHALGETRTWYGDYARSITGSFPWFLRGGIYDNTTVAGVFGFCGDIGCATGDWSFRVVLASTT